MEPTPRAVERKVVTALFCDVVGSTELGERLDPEDIDRLMAAYHRLARRRVETNGGSVEKFIGDAVVGVFGAPIVHEDDPARAIRAALGIITDLESSGLDLQVRIGIQSGLAVVRVGDDRTAEEGLATGDILNTAARLQNTASPGEIAVGEPTYQRTKAEFVWEDLGEVPLKGKAQPVHVWRPIDERLTSGADTAEATEFVGRDRELARLLEVFERAATEQRMELVTIVAGAGMGKSRLVRELASRIQAKGVQWRKGRCLPYGDGISFWALAEIVKSSAGIVETDDQSAIRRKLDSVIAEPDPDVHAWLRDRLAPLAGLRTDAAAAPQEESFAAWSRFLASLAIDGPLVVVIEDLHWADASLVAFLAHLAEQSVSAPILLIVTARPEVSERHPEWLTRADQSTLLQLVSLGDDAIRALVESTLADASPELVSTVLERAAGSPLYAEQLAAFVAERGLSAAAATLDEGAIPATIQALLAARIDALPGDLKPALLDASVIGRTFWLGAVASLEDAEPDAVATRLEHLARRELTREVVPSTLEGEAEYGFWHALLRDVAYSFLPRTARLAKHRSAAAWIAARARGTLGDLAEIVADHLRRALDLATAAAADDEVPLIRSDLADALLAAGDHLAGIEPVRAVTHLRAALDLLAPDDARRPGAYSQLGQTLMARAQYVESAEAYEQGVAAHRARGNELAAAELSIKSATALFNAGRAETARHAIEAARPVLEANPGSGLLELYVLGVVQASRGTGVQATEIAARRALELAERLGLPRPYRALAERGMARLDAGDPAGSTDMREAFDLALVAGDRRYAVTSLSNRAASLSNAVDALAAFDEAIAQAGRYGISDGSMRAQRFDTLELAGRWDEVIADAPAMLAAARARGDAFAEFMVRMGQAGVRAARGEAPEDVDDLVEKAAAIGLRSYVPGSLLAQVALVRGDYAAARRAILDTIAAVPDGEYVTGAPALVEVAVLLGDVHLARQVLGKARPGLADGGPNGMSDIAVGLVLEAEGDLAGAIGRFETSSAFMLEHGWTEAAAQALAGLGRCRLARGEVDSGLAALRQAREIGVSLKATPRLARIDAAIAAATSHQDPR